LAIKRGNYIEIEGDLGGIVGEICKCITLMGEPYRSSLAPAVNQVYQQFLPPPIIIGEGFFRELRPEKKPIVSKIEVSGEMFPEICKELRNFLSNPQVVEFEGGAIFISLIPSGEKLKLDFVLIKKEEKQ